MTGDKFRETTGDNFAAAKMALEKCAFDGVEAHGGNGFLPQQFLRSNITKRTDDHGGSPEKSCNFVFDVMSGLAEAVGQELGAQESPSMDLVRTTLLGFTSYPSLEQQPVLEMPETAQSSRAYRGQFAPLALAKRTTAIVSGVAIQTPKLLQLPGIGDPTVLDGLGIDVVVDLPGVGVNLRDHSGVLSVGSANAGINNELEINIDPVLDAEQGVLYNKNQTGRWTECGDCLAFLASTNISSTAAVKASVLASMDTATSLASLPPGHQRQRHARLRHPRRRDPWRAGRVRARGADDGVVPRGHGGDAAAGAGRRGGSDVARVWGTTYAIAEKAAGIIKSGASSLLE